MVYTCVAITGVFAISSGVLGAFTFGGHQWGDVYGQPYTTSDGSAFYVNSAQDDGEGRPSLMRPLNGAGWVAGNDLEWTTYITESASPSRRSGTPNNQSDLFYMTRGVYPADFASANARIVSFTPGTAGAAALTGTLFGASIIPGPFRPTSASPEGLGVDGTQLEGIMLGRMTVRRGATIAGKPNLIGTGDDDFTFSVDLVLDGPLTVVSGPSRRRLALRSYLVAQVDIADDGFDQDGEAFGAADVYDIWLTEVIPAPSAAACAGLASLGMLRRRRG